MKRHAQTNAALPGMSPAPTEAEPQAHASDLAAFSAFFRDAETARTLAWMAVDHASRGLGTWSVAAVACHKAADYFTRAASMAEAKRR